MHRFDPKRIDILISEERKKEIGPLKYLKENGLKKDVAFTDIRKGRYITALLVCQTFFKSFIHCSSLLPHTKLFKYPV
ncbi:MAG: hypothetical protein AABY58_05565 [Nitrospirota bacterium]